jgi:cysteine desulfurase
MIHQPIYLDNAAAARPSDSVIHALLPYHREDWGAVGAPHHMGQDVLPRLAKDYTSIYEMLGAHEADDFVLTSSGAEAVNQVLMGCYHDLTRDTGQNHFITSNSDEAPVIMGIGRLEQLGCVGRMVEVGEKGFLSADDIAGAITPRTALVSLSWANAMTGVIQPVEEIAAVCQDRGIFFHLEASQVLGRHYIDLQEAGADFISFSGEVIHGPKGTGGLWIRHGMELSPFIVGGADQMGRRAGTLNAPGLAGLAQAAREVLDNLDQVSMEGARLRDLFEERILATIPDTQVFFKQLERVPTTSCIAFPGVVNEALLYSLNELGVYASIGGGGFQQIALILEGCGVDPTLAQTAVSFTMSRETSEAEVEEAVKRIEEAVTKLRKLSQACVPGVIE